MKCLTLNINRNNAILIYINLAQLCFILNSYWFNCIKMVYFVANYHYYLTKQSNSVTKNIIFKILLNNVCKYINTRMSFIEYKFFFNFM
jgi:CDP-diglyceride synthetase